MELPLGDGSPPAATDIRQWLAQGEVLRARQGIAALAVQAGDDARQLHEAAQLFMQIGDPALADDLYRRAVALDPACTAYRYNHATALIALGRMAEAEAALDHVIAVQPDDADAWYNRATLRRQTRQRNHVAALRGRLRRPGLAPAQVAPLAYALAKELEDLEHYDESFTALLCGARARRAMLSYDIEDDEAMLRAIGDAFTREQVRAGAPGHGDARPVFVVGLPRSGTTLVERMLSSHAGIDSHGESMDFALSLMQVAGPVRDKADLLARSTRLDPRRLGEAYARRLALHGGARVVDKTPGNFLYLGLIARALPQARIIHVRRRPMDVCHAIFKTLFRMAYPYSYDLDDLARYWLAFDALMRHWQDVLPAGRMLTVDYESLVQAPADHVRAMLAHLEMPWDDACLHFERNPLPSLTASAAQVRRPVYTSSVGLWRHHVANLAPLARRFRDAGVDIDTRDAA